VAEYIQKQKMYEIKNNNYQTMYDETIKQSLETSNSHISNYGGESQGYESKMPKQNSNYDLFKLK